MNDIKFKQEYCEQLKNHMAKGYSFESFSGKIFQKEQTLNDWCLVFPEFKEAKDVGTELRKKKIEGMRSGNLTNSIAAMFLRKNVLRGN